MKSAPDRLARASTACSRSAHSSEDILHIVAAGAGGFVGVSGAVGVTLISSTTEAVIEGGAQIDTLHHFTQHIVQKNNAGPLFLMAHSMGAHLGLRYLNEHAGVFDSYRAWRSSCS